MPCILALLVVLFPRIAIVLLYFFTDFFRGIYDTLLIPLLGFLFLPLTLITYTYLKRNPTDGTTFLVILFVAVIVDLGLIGGGSRFRRGD
ncbi:MAG TPA: hypothetical protein VE621_09295 [Bryobacteraceae bacterium]|jgi:putative exporter of polyketide antibiotics|nr:hypothetical protein [Bryobacteraceae bacterium]